MFFSWRSTPSSSITTLANSLLLVLLLTSPSPSSGCSSLVAGREATTTGATLVSHSNDGDGDVAGNIRVVPASTNSLPSNRTVSRGVIPNVQSTFQYHTEGYAIINEKQVALGESTCSSIYSGSGSQQLNIVDLGQLCLERASSASACISTMGELATTYGYYDAGESLFVTDPYVP